MSSHTRRPLIFLALILLLSALLMAGCARGTRLNGGATLNTPAAVSPAAGTDGQELDQVDQTLSQIQTELNQTDTVADYK